MIPQTIGALLAFFALFAPGVLFELLRERRRPAFRETAFREASRTALVSLCFTLFSLVALFGLSLIIKDILPDIDRWIEQGAEYAEEAYWKILVALILEVTIACGAAYIWDRVLTGRATGSIVAVPIWFRVLRAQRPKNTTPWIHVKLDDKTEFRGYLDTYTSDFALADHEIALRGPKLQIIEETTSEPRILNNWMFITIRGEKIAWMKITYIDNESGEIIRPMRQTKRRIRIFRRDVLRDSSAS